MSTVPRLIQRFRSRELAKALGHLNLEPNASVQLQNPFIPFLNPTTKRWAPPVYSMRRQAELVKAAQASNTLHLLPPGPKLGPTELSKFSQPQPINAGPPHSSSKMFAKAREEAGFADVSVEWVGEVKEKNVPGADVGARLYAGKKRMFKGHKWEREFKKRKAKIAVRLRDMPKRIERFKSVSTVFPTLCMSKLILICF